MTAWYKNTVVLWWTTIAVLVSSVLIILYVLLDGRRPGLSASVPLFSAMPNQPAIKISDVTGEDPTIVAIVEKVNKHILIPDGKVTVATITNIDGLRQENPVLYQFAKNGDKALIYPDRLILYNPDIDRVLDVWHDEIIFNQ